MLASSAASKNTPSKTFQAWGERHGRPAAHVPSGRTLLERPSDGSFVYTTCFFSGRAKSDFVTLHGFIGHQTKKHRNRTVGSESPALEMCGIVYGPHLPLLPVAVSNRGWAQWSTTLLLWTRKLAHRVWSWSLNLI